MKDAGMVRRKFLGLLTLGGVGGAAVLSARKLADRRTATYRVKGFTCITCATGLETLLQREKGVLAAQASYPEGVATVTYDAGSITPETIGGLIESMGFHAILQKAEA